MDSTVKRVVGYTNLWVVLFMSVLVFFASSFYRYHQYKVWKQYPKVYFVDGYPAMTTLDAYYWLRYAKEYKSGTYYKTDNDTLRAYPDAVKKPHPIPMLSFLISEFSSITGSSIYMSGLILVPVLASLFVFPLVFYFWLVDMPFAGVVGSFVGAFSWMYTIRTAMGRVDTDLLQLFFLFCGALLVLLSVETENNKNRYIYSALLGVNFLLFGWWYGHLGIDVVYLVVFVLMLYLHRYKIGKKQIILSVLLFIVFADPIWIFNGISGVFEFFFHYGKISNVSSGNFPNILKTITEAEHLSIIKTISYVLSNRLLDWIGLFVSFVALVVMRIKAIPLIPIFFLGLLAFRSSNRTVMFLAPFIGSGIGFVFDWIFGRVGLAKTRPILTKVISPLVVLIVIVLLIIPYTSYKFVPQPSIAAPIMKSFIGIKKKIKKAVIFSWWDYGYAIEDVDGYATYQDGGAHGGARTYLVAKALISDNQTLLYHIVSFMDRYGVKPIVDAIKYDNKSAREAVKVAFDYSKPINSKDNYILFTQDMIGKYYAISYLGSWNFKEEKSHPYGYVMLFCNAFRNGKFMCNKNIINVDNGTIDNKLAIKKIIYVVNGNIVRVRDYPYPYGLYVEFCINKIDNREVFRFALVCNKRVYDSNFNKLFILGRYNKDMFEEVYNNFPVARMYRVK